MIEKFGCEWLEGHPHNDVKLIALLTNLVDIEVQMLVEQYELTQVREECERRFCHGLAM